MLGSTANSGKFANIGQNLQGYLAQTFYALFVKISCNTFFEFLKHADQPGVDFVNGI